MGFGDRPIFVRANISDVEMYGAEAEIRYDLLASLSFSGNYAYTHSTIISYTKIAENDTIDLSGKFFTDVPAHIFTVGANWNNKYVNTSLYVRYNGAMLFVRECLLQVNSQLISECVCTPAGMSDTFRNSVYWKK